MEHRCMGPWNRHTKMVTKVLLFPPPTFVLRPSYSPGSRVGRREQLGMLIGLGYWNVSFEKCQRAQAGEYSQ